MMPAASTVLDSCDEGCAALTLGASSGEICMAKLTGYPYFPCIVMDPLSIPAGAPAEEFARCKKDEKVMVLWLPCNPGDANVFGSKTSSSTFSIFSLPQLVPFSSEEGVRCGCVGRA